MAISATLVLPELVGILTIFESSESTRPLSIAILCDGHVSETEWLSGAPPLGPLARSIM